MINLTINGQTLEVPENTTVLQAAEQAGIIIPTLCHHKDLTPFGGCRLCSVDIQGLRLPATACTMLCSPGMVVRTESPDLTRYRRTILELLLVRFYDAGYRRTPGTPPELDSQFAYWVHHYGIDMHTAMAQAPFRQIDSDPNPFIWVDKNKCIMCTRCVRACAEVQARFVWTQAYRGYDLRIVAGADTTMLQARCESCGACVAHCPTGALDNKMSVKLGLPDRLVPTTCSYCGVGCQLQLEIKDDVPGGRLLRVSSDSRPSVNGDHLCVKGRYGYDFVHSPQRLSSPRVRKYLLDGAPRPGTRGPWVEVDWDTALDIAAQGLRSARDKYGPASLGLLGSGRLLNEENYLLNKLARQVLGTNNIDCSEHIQHPCTVEGLESSLGLTAQTNSFEDVASNSASVLVIGSNTTEQHPIFGVMLRRAVLKRGLRLVVAHPDFINISEYAALRLVHKPGTEAALVNGLCRLMLQNGWADREFIEKHTSGFPAFEESLLPYTPLYVSAVTGLEPSDLLQAAEILSHHSPMAVVWGTELVDKASPVENVQALANLQLLLGNFGVPGGGLIPLRSQNNSQGGTDMGAHPCIFPGYQNANEPATRRKFEAAWGRPVPSRPGLSALEMISSAAEGRLRLLYAVCGDVIGGAADAGLVRQALRNCDFVVVQGVFESETSRNADVLLPGVTFAEKTGTFTSSERRVQMVRQAIQPQGLSLPDWLIISRIASRILPALETGEFGGWCYSSTAQVMAEIAALTPPYAGISHDRLEKLGSLQWPVKNLSHPGTPMLGLESLSGGRARFTPAKMELEMV